MSDKKGSNEHESGIFREAFSKWLGLFLVLVAAGLFYFIVANVDIIFEYIMYITGILKPVIYGCVIAYILNPLMKMYQRWFTKAFLKRGKPLSEKAKGIINGVTITLALFTGILIIVILFMMIIPQIITSILVLINTLPQQADTYYNKIVAQIENNKFIADTMQEAALQGTKFLDEKMNTELIPWLRTELLPNINTFAKQFASGVAAFISVLYNLFIGMIVAIYLLKSKRVFAAQSKKIVYGIFKKPHADIIIHYVRISNNMFSGFISGKIVDSTIIGIICFVVMNIMNLPYAMLVSVIVGVTNVIPVFGPYLGAIPSTFLILLVNPVQAVYFLILIIVLQQLDGNIIGPAILGESTGLTAFWVLFSILLFGGMWGIFGMLIGCPLFAVIYRIIKDFIATRLKGKMLSEETQSYIDLNYINISQESAEYIKYTDDELNSKKKKDENKQGIVILAGNKIKKKISRSSNIQNDLENKDDKLD